MSVHQAQSNKSPLRQLADIISSSVDKIDLAFQTSSLKYPDLNVPFNPTSPAEAKSMSPDVIQSAALIVAACAQLSATVNIPALTLYDASCGFHVASVLRAALEANVVEILRNQPQGLSAPEIAEKNNMDPTRLTRLLRLLATHHIFVESSPGTFCNNRLSSMMDTLKSVDDILANPKDKHVGTPGMSAIIEHSGDEIFKASAFLTEVLLDPTMGHSESVEHTPLAVAFNTKKHAFDWYEEPQNEARFKRFAAAMAGSAKLDPPDAILLGFDWGVLPPNSFIVDVGGGMGHTCITLVEKYPNLKYVVQDRPPVIDQAKEFWERTHPGFLGSRVTLQAHDFFTPQPIKDAAVFVLRMIVHDFGKEKATNILQQLRKAATLNTKLLLVEQIVPYACLDGTSVALYDNIPGGKQMIPPPPLLANMGKANAITNIGDFQMFTSVGGEERTLGTFISLTEGAGWKIIQVFPIPGSLHKQILAVPV